jgi:RNA polymerase sigma-70 factor (ECF subfamily)
MLKKVTFNNEIKFKAYLFKTGRNLAFNYMKRSSLIKIVYFENYTEEIMDEKTLLEEIILKDEQKRLLRNSMQKLNADYREILHLIYFEDMSYDMAGIVMKKNRKHIENLVYRARKQLKIIIEEDGLFYEK